MTRITTPALRTWAERLDSGTLTKSQISQFGQAITRPARGYLPQGRPTVLTNLERHDLARQVERHPVRLTPEHTEQGLTWLTRNGRKALDMPEDVHDTVISMFHHFSWDGDVDVFGDYDRVTVPVWTVHLGDGRKLKYAYAPWVSGVNRSWWEWVS